MRVDVSLEDIARYLRIDASVIGCVVRKPVRDRDAKASRKRQQRQSNNPLPSLPRHCENNPNERLKEEEFRCGICAATWANKYAF